jgi:hypothetical protein
MYDAAEAGAERHAGRRCHAVEGRGGRQAGHARRCHQAPGRLPQGRRGRQRHAGRGHRAVERRRPSTWTDISKGDIPPKITDNYNGDFNEIKNNLNTCIDNVNALVADAACCPRRRWKASWHARRCHQAPGRLPQGRRRRERHAGRGHRTAECVRRVCGPHLQGRHPARITDNYNGDFNEIKNNLNTCIDAVGALVADAVMLSKAAVEGKAGDAGRRQQAPGRFPQDRRGRR